MSTFKGKAIEAFKTEGPHWENNNDPNCLCERRPLVYKCKRCYQFYKGRKREVCPVHPNIAFLMDVHECPYCQAPKNYLLISDEENLMIAEATPVPDDYDL